MVAGYNEDDCRATLALRDWLEARRSELAESWEGPAPPRRRGEGHRERDPDVARIRAALLAGIPDDPAERTPDQQAKALLADLLDGTAGTTSRPGGGTSMYAP